MSVGVSIYYKMVYEDDIFVILQYSGVDQSRPYHEDDVLLYDGILEIDKVALCDEHDVIKSLENEQMRVVRCSKHDTFFLKGKSDERRYPLFALKIFSKVKRTYIAKNSIEEKGGVVY